MMSVIYKISCKDENITDCYIGSTINKSVRKATHKYSCNNENDKCYNFKVYKFIRDNGGFDNWKFIILQELETTDKNVMLKKERYYYDLNNATLNTQKPNRTYIEYHKEYQKENEYKIIQRSKNHYEQNKKEILERQKKRYENMKKKFNCNICNGLTNNYTLKRHQRSSKCKKIYNKNVIDYFNLIMSFNN